VKKRKEWTKMKRLLNRSAITRMQAAIIVVIIVIAIVAVAVGYWAMRPAPTRDYFKIGVIAELTGDFARGGYDIKRGYDLWADTINEMGGIPIGGKNYAVQLIYYDAKSDPAVGAAATEKAITEGCDFLLGPYSSAVTLGSGPICEKYGMPMITGSAESHRIPLEKFKWVFQILVTTKETPKAPIKVLATLPVKTAAIIGGDDAFSKGLAESFKSEAEGIGLTVVYYEIFPVDLKDLSPLISKIKALNPDVFIVAGHPENHIVAVRNSKELGFNPKIFLCHWGVDTPDFLGELKADANYVVGVTMWSPKAAYEDPVFGTTAKLAEKYEVVYGLAPDYTAASCAATGVFFQKVVEQLGLTPPFDDAKKAKLRDGIETISVKTALGEVKFSTDPEHWHVNIGLAELLVVIQIKDVKPVPIAPEALKEMDIVFPKPPW